MPVVCSFPATATFIPRRAARVAALAAVLLLLMPPGLAQPTAPNSPAAGTAALEAPPPMIDLAALEAAFTGVVADVSPAVVGLRVERVYLLGVDEDGAVNSQVATISGSGTIIQPDGYILTNEHVVQSARSIEVVFHDGTTAPGHLFAADPRSDLAIIHVDRTDLPTAPWCRWMDVRRGQWTLAVGNPYGLGGDGQACVSVGVISNLGRALPGLGSEDDRLYHDMIQTTAAVNPGNSGGPLFNVHGELIGIVTAVYTRAGADPGVGFAIPLSAGTRRMVQRLLNGEPIEYGYLGVAVTAAERSEGQPGRVRITELEGGGPADLAGLQIGDVITNIAGTEIGAGSQLAAVVGTHAPGDTVAVEFERAGTPLRLQVTLGRRDAAHVAWLRLGAVLWRGMRLVEIDTVIEHAGEDSPLGGLLVVEVLPDTPAAAGGIARGDFVDAVAGQPVSTLREFEAQIYGLEGAVDLTLGGGTQVRVTP